MVTQYSISSSALNNWLWEDITLAGAEGEWWHTTRPGIKLGALQERDTAVIRPADAGAGWVMGDTFGGINGSLALPNRGERTDIFNERDQRPALYGWLSLGDDEEIASLKFGMFDNRGDERRPGSLAPRSPRSAS